MGIGPSPVKFNASFAYALPARGARRHFGRVGREPKMNYRADLDLEQDLFLIIYRVRRVASAAQKFITGPDSSNALFSKIAKGTPMVF